MKRENYFLLAWRLTLPFLVSCLGQGEGKTYGLGFLFLLHFSLEPSH